MKSLHRIFLYSVVFLLTRQPAFAQAGEPVAAPITVQAAVTVPDAGIKAFLRQDKMGNPDYTEPFQLLSDEVERYPDNASLRYYLGYTIDRMNARDGTGIAGVQLEMTRLASEQLEASIHLEPTFSGDIYNADPYTKLTSVWGCQAAGYLVRNQKNSARRAFEEGKHRGGFLEPVLRFGRHLLQSCDSQAILITDGDLITFPAWYLQVVEGLRPDITVIDVNLLSTAWYPKYLKEVKKVAFDLPEITNKPGEFIAWKKQRVTITHPDQPKNNFSWELAPAHLGAYLLYGDLVLLNILKKNFFSRPVYLQLGVDMNAHLSLTSYLWDDGLVYRLKAKKYPDNYKGYTVSPNLMAYHIDPLKEDDIRKSPDVTSLLNLYRVVFYDAADKLGSTNSARGDEAFELLHLMVKRFPLSKLPFSNQKIEEAMKVWYE